MASVEAVIGYTFQNKELLQTALQHSSYVNESKKGMKNNERLEFLGDSVLSIIVSDYLFKHFNHVSEGDLSKLRASIVCEKSLYQWAKLIDLGGFLFLGKGEEMTGGRDRPSILSDAFEAVIAAIYLDGGIEPARTFVMRFARPAIEDGVMPKVKDYKTTLQEIIQQNPEEVIEYVLVEESGPDHDKRFVIEIHLNSNVIGRGVGRSKKQAEQLAAKEALELMGQPT